MFLLENYSEKRINPHFAIKIAKKKNASSLARINLKPLKPLN